MKPHKLTLDDVITGHYFHEREVIDWHVNEVKSAGQEAILAVAPKIWEHATGAWNLSNSDRDRAEHLHSLRKLLASASGNTWTKEAS